MSNHAGDSDSPERAHETQAPASEQSSTEQADKAEQTPAHAQNRFGVLAALAVVAVLGVVGASFWPVLTGRSPQSPQTNAETNAPESGTAPAASAPIATGTQIPPANTPGFTDLATRLSGVETQLNAVQSEVARAADRDALAALQDRVSRLEADSSGTVLRRAGALLALATLARAADEGMPFKVQLDALSAAAPGDPALATFAPYADVGVPTLAMLSARYSDEAYAALDAERRAGAGPGFLSRLWTSFTGLIHVRRVGDVEGTTSADRLARGEADLGRGDLAGAVMETRALEGAAAAAMASWLKDAQARLDIDRAIADLDARLAQGLAAPAQGQSP